MKWDNAAESVWQLTAVPIFAKIFIGMFLGLFWVLGVSTSVYASSISDELFIQALEEEFGALEDLGELEDVDDSYDMDINEFAEQYIKDLEEAGVSLEGFEGEIIQNPRLEMTISEDGMFRYILPDGNFYDVNVPNGMYSSTPVTFSIPSDVAAVVTKDGESKSLIRDWRFFEPGEYQVKLLFYRLESEQAGDFHIYEVYHVFRIVGKAVNSFGAVPAPEGFEIVSAKKDGVSLEVEHPKMLFLEQDGVYEIRFCDQKTGAVFVTTSFEKDTVAPFLTFSMEIGEGAVDGPVEFTKGAATDQVQISYNGSIAPATGNELSTQGTYLLKVSDEVGNDRAYGLEIKQTYRIFETKTVLLILLFFAGVGLWFALQKREQNAI